LFEVARREKPRPHCCQLQRYRSVNESTVNASAVAAVVEDSVAQVLNNKPAEESGDAVESIANNAPDSILNRGAVGAMIGK